MGRPGMRLLVLSFSINITISMRGQYHSQP